MTQLTAHVPKSSSTAADCVSSRSQLVASLLDASRGRRPPVPGQESSKEMTEERHVVMATNSSSVGRCSTPPGQLIMFRHQNYGVVDNNSSHRTTRSTSGTPRKSATVVVTTFGKHHDSHRRLLSDDDRQMAPLGFEPEGCCDVMVNPEVNRDDVISATKSIENDELKSNCCDRLTNHSDQTELIKMNDDISLTSRVPTSSSLDSARCHAVVNDQPEVHQVSSVIEEGNRGIVPQHGGTENVMDSRMQTTLNHDHVIGTVHSMDISRCVNDSNATCLDDCSLFVSKDDEGAMTQLNAQSDNDASYRAPNNYWSCQTFRNTLHHTQTKSSSGSKSNDTHERVTAKDAHTSLKPVQHIHSSVPRALRLGSLSTATNDRNLAEVDPERFVAILWDKLKGGVGSATSRRIQQKATDCSNIENGGETASLSTDQPHHRKLPTNGVLNRGGEFDGSSTLSSLRSLVTAASSVSLHPDTEDACAEAILENHFRRVWDASSDDDIVIARSGNNSGVFAQPSRVRSRLSPSPLTSSTSAPFSESRVCDAGVIAGTAGPEARWNSSSWRRRSTALITPVSCPTGANLSASSVPELASLIACRRLSMQHQHAEMSSSAIDCFCRIGIESPLFQRDHDCSRNGTRWSTSATMLPCRTTDRPRNSDVDDDNGSSECCSSAAGRIVDRRVSQTDSTSGRAHSSSDINAAYVPADSDATAALHDAVRRLEYSSVGSCLEDQLANCHGWAPSMTFCPPDDTSAAVVQRCRRHHTCGKTTEDARKWCGSLSDDSPGCPQDSSAVDHRWCCRPGLTREDFHRSQSTCCSVVQDTSFDGSKSLIFHGCQWSTIARPSTSSTTTCSGTEIPVHDACVTVVGYYIGDDSIPYRTTAAGKRVTLAQFKRLLSKKGDFRYFFKTPSNEFDSGAVMEEIFDDDTLLPLWEGKILGKVELKL